MNKYLSTGLSLLLFLLASGDIHAQLQIEVTGGAGRRAPVAVVPFAWEGEDATVPFDITGLIAADLDRSGRFAPIPEEDMLQKPTSGVDVDFEDWSILGVSRP